MVRKVAVLMVASIVKDAYFQTFYALLITVTSLLAQLSWHPYNDPVFNRLESSTLVALVLTQMVSIMYLRSEETVAPADDELATETSAGATATGSGGGQAPTLSPSRESDAWPAVAEGMATAALVLVNAWAVFSILRVVYKAVRKSARSKRKASRARLRDRPRVPTSGLNHEGTTRNPLAGHEQKRRRAAPRKLGRPRAAEKMTQVAARSAQRARNKTSLVI